MDLPKAAFYGVSCAVCEKTLWSANQQEAELRLDVSFKDKGLDFIRTQLGLILGFGRFEHACVTLENIMKKEAKDFKDMH